MKLIQKCDSFKLYTKVFLFIFTVFLIHYSLSDSCPNGMRKTAIDYHSFNPYGGAVFYEDNRNCVADEIRAGAFWSGNRVLIEPRFEVHLKVNVKYSIYSYNHNINGFTIILAKTGGYEAWESNSLGYAGIRNSFIAEFDFYQNSGDPSDHCLSIHKCFNSQTCSTSKSGTKTVTLYNIFNTGGNNYFEYTLKYIDKTLTIYEGDRSVYTEGIDLESKFGEPVAYLGISAGSLSYYICVDAQGSFYCQDDYDISKMTGNFWVDNKETNSVKLKAGIAFKYLFSFINNRNQVIPHTYGYGMWTYAFKISTSCSDSNTEIIKKDLYGIFLSMGCKKVGKHYLTIKEEGKGQLPIKYFYIIPNDLAKIVIIGHSGKIQTVQTFADNAKPGYKYLKFGAAIDKHFTISDNKQIIVDIKATDQYDNLVPLEGVDDNNLLSKCEMTLESKNGASIAMKRKDDNYQLIISFTSPGTYRVNKNRFMEYGYTFKVYPGAPDASKSSCSIYKAQSDPIIDEGVELTYTCDIKDIQGNVLTTSEMENVYGYGFSCEAIRNAPSALSHQVSVEGGSTSNSCKIKAQYMGNYKFHAYFYKKSSPKTKYEISSRISAFSVLPIPVKLPNTKAYRIDTGKWFDANSASFPYQTNKGGFITALDLVDRDGKTLVSAYGKYSPNFNLNYMTAKLTSPHDKTYTFKNLSLKWVTLNGKPYVGVYTAGEKNTDDWITRSSYDYVIAITLKSVLDSSVTNFQVTLKYQLAAASIGSYKTCFHPLETKNTIVTYSFNGDDKKSFKVIAGNQITIGTLALQTTDKQLYNYDIGTNNIKVVANPASKDLTFGVTKNTIPGTYTITAKSNAAIQTSIQIYVNNVPVGNAATILILSSNCYSIEVLNTNSYNYDKNKKIYYYKNKITVDNGSNHKFRLKDKYGNYLNKVDGIGLKVTGSLNGKVMAQNTYSFSFKNDNSYTIEENIHNLGTYSWVATCTDSGNKAEFSYTKSTGEINMSKSSMKLNANEIHVSETSYSTITLLDQFGNNVGTDNGRLEEAKKSITVIGVGNNKEYKYEFEQIISKTTLRYKCTINEETELTVTAKYSNNVIPCGNANLKVTYETIDTTKSKLQALLDTTVDMSPTTSTTIKSAIQVPVYKYLVYNKNNARIYNFDKSKISCLMQSTKTQRTWNLIVSIESDYLLFKHNEEDSNNYRGLPKGNYILKVTVSGTTVQYPLALLGENGSEDASEDTEMVPSKCSPEKVEINGIAGVEKSGNIEFRCNDGLRWNFKGDNKLFTFKNSYNLKNTEISMKFEYGGKKGQFMFTVTQNIVTTSNNKNVITLYYDGKELNTKIYLTIKNSDFYRLVYVSGLKDGTVVELPTLLFMPQDKFGNEYTELFSFNQKTLNSITSGATSNKAEITSNNFVDTKKDRYLHVQYKVKKQTTITITSKYFVQKDEKYSYLVKHGPLDATNTRIEFGKGPYNIPESYVTYTITPKDIYGNPFNSLSTDDIKDFDMTYTNDKNPGEKFTVDLKKDCTANTETLVIECKSFVTEAGVNTFDANYKEKDVQCTGSCSVSVNPGAIDFTKTTTYYTNKKTWMVPDKYNTIIVGELPNFQLTFHDEYNNEVVDKNLVKSFEVTPGFKGADISLCTSDSENHKIISLCSDEASRTGWSFLLNGKQYTLIIGNNNVNISYPLETIGGDSADDGSTAELDVSKTQFNPTDLTITAGSPKDILMELKAVDGKRKNFFYKTPSDKIQITFNKDQNNCASSIKYGEKPGRYYITVNCKIANKDNGFTVNIEDKKAPTGVAIHIIPASPATAKLYQSKDDNTPGAEITSNKIGETTIDGSYSVFFRLYDSYKNQVYDFTVNNCGLIFTLSKAAGNSGNSDGLAMKNQIMGNNDDKYVKLTFTAERAGTYKLTGTFFLKPLNYYEITFKEGKISPKNCQFIVDPENIVAGNAITGYIIPYDQYGNYIDPTGQKNPFHVNIEHDVENSDGTTKKQTETIKSDTATIKTFNNLKTFAFPITLTYRGTNKFDPEDATTSEDVKCVKCLVNVQTAQLDFLKSDYKRFNSGISAFEELKNGTLEKNVQEDAFYRIYPRDIYGNKIDFIPEEDLKTYKSFLTNKKDSTIYNLVLSNERYTQQPYAQFIKYDKKGDEVTYETLIGGEYTLTFANTKNNKVFEITLAGREGDGDASNKPVDPQKTHINEFNLEFVAGKSGHMFIELRTTENKRKNFWEGFNIGVKSCDANDKTFNYKVDKSGTLGVFYVTVSTNKGNTYPKYVDCPLTITLNDEVVNDLKPLMKVSSNTLDHSVIIEKYWKKPESNAVLIDGNADNKYIFEVRSYDVYENLCETLQKSVDISITYGGAKIESTQKQDTETGYLKYSLDVKKAGTYTVTSAIKEKNGKQYLPNDSEFSVLHGSIDPSKGEIELEKKKYTAGEQPVIGIINKDTNGNIIPASEIIGAYNTTVTDSAGKEHLTKSEVDPTNPNKVIYTTVDQITTSGEGKIKVVYPKTGEDFADKPNVDNKVQIVPAEPDPKMSIVSAENSLNVWKEYENGETITAITSNPIELKVKLRDTYGNVITSVPDNFAIADAKMEGNEMTPFNFDVIKDGEIFHLDFQSNPDAVEIYNHLVAGSYSVGFKATSSLGNAEFNYPIDLSTGKNDSEHGNGAPSAGNCVLIPDSIEFTAGETNYFTLEVRTKKGKLINNDMTINDKAIIDVLLDKEDKTFTYEISKKGNEYGIYSIGIKSNIKQSNAITVNVFDKEKGSLIPIKNKGKFTVTAKDYPDQKKTQIVDKSPSVIDGNTKVVLKFILADEFGNVFENRDDIVKNKYLTATNNGLATTDTEASLDSKDHKTYTVTFKPAYPPRNISINVQFNNGQKTVICFPEDIKIFIDSDADFTKAVVNSINAESILVGNLLNMQVYLYDNNGVSVEKDYADHLKVVVTGENKTEYSKEYKFKKSDDPELKTQNQYEIITKDPDDIYKKTGNYNIIVYGDTTVIKTYKQVCITDTYDINGFIFRFVGENFDENKVIANSDVILEITGNDKFGNRVTKPLNNTINLTLTINGESVIYNLTRQREEEEGTLLITINEKKMGKVDIHLSYKNETIQRVKHKDDQENPMPSMTVIPAECNGHKNHTNFNTSEFEDASLNELVSFVMQCEDEYGNKISTGGDQFIVRNKVSSKGSVAEVTTTVVDNKDGTYTASFTPKVAGNYLIDVVMNEKQYGNQLNFTIRNYYCDVNSDKPYLCPNKQKKICVKDPIECIEPRNDCDSDKPFKCNVTTKGKTEMTCVASQTDCDCPEGYVKCKYQKYCVPKAKKKYMCTYFSKNCKKTGLYKKMGKDYVCRDTTESPSQRVCPIGYQLCPDLTCAKSVEECVVNNVDTRVGCSNQDGICPDQSCRIKPERCPSTIKCSNKNYVVCPDGECVKNEIYCKELPKHASNKYLCADNSLKNSWKDCGASVIACGNGKFLCEDKICRKKC